MAQEFSEAYMNGLCQHMPQSNDPAYIRDWQAGWNKAFLDNKFGLVRACPWPKPDDIGYCSELALGLGKNIILEKRDD